MRHTRLVTTMLNVQGLILGFPLQFLVDGRLAFVFKEISGVMDTSCNDTPCNALGNFSSRRIW